MVLHETVTHAVQRWAHARILETDIAFKVLQESYEKRSLEPTKHLNAAIILNAIALLLLANLFLVALTRPGRRMIWVVVETVLATAATIALLLFVLSLPFGALFLIYKAAVYLVRNLLAVPGLNDVLRSIQGPGHDAGPR